MRLQMLDQPLKLYYLLSLASLLQTSLKIIALRGGEIIMLGKNSYYLGHAAIVAFR